MWHPLVLGTGEPETRQYKHGRLQFPRIPTHTCSWTAMMHRVRLLARSRPLVHCRAGRAMSSQAHNNFEPLTLDPPSPEVEKAAFDARVAAMESFFALPRFASTTRPYTAAAVASKQGSLPPLPLPNTLLADKLYALLQRASAKGLPLHTMGAIDPVQMTQMAPHLPVLYVSGWAASSVLTTGNNEVGPDLG